MPLATLTEEIKTLTDKLDALGVKYAAPNVQLFSGYWPAAQALMPPVPVATSLYGGRLVPRDVVLENPRGLVGVLRDVTGEGEGVSYASLGVNVNRSVAGEVDNAVLPAWREALLDVVLVVYVRPLCIYTFMLLGHARKGDADKLLTKASVYDSPAPETASMAELLALQQKMTGWVAQLESITPGSGCYLNEVRPPPPRLLLPNNGRSIRSHSWSKMQIVDLSFPSVGRFPRPKLENDVLRRQLRSPKGDQGEVGSG